MMTYSRFFSDISPGDGTNMSDFGAQVEDLGPMKPDFARGQQNWPLSDRYSLRVFNFSYL